MNDRKKTVLLLLLVFAVFGLAGWRVSSVPGQVTPSSGPQTVSLDSNGQTAGGGSITLSASGASGKATSAAKPLTVPPPAPVAGPDPFRAAVQAGSQVKVQPDLAYLRKSAPRESSSAAVRNSDLDQPVSPLKGDILPSASSGIEVRPDPAPALKVSAVLTGDKPVAIIKLGDQQFVVSVGDVFGDGYVLKSVTTTQVVIVQGKKKIFLPTMGL